MAGPTQGHEHPSDDGAADGAVRHAHGSPPGRPRPSDAAIADIATQVARAVPLPPPDDQTTWILAQRAELPGEDEGRVIRALVQRLRDVRLQARLASSPGGPSRRDGRGLEPGPRGDEQGRRDEPASDA